MRWRWPTSAGAVWAPTWLCASGVYEVEPLAPENPLIFAPGPLTGTGAPASGRYSVSSRSPLTGTVFDGNSGGAFGVALRRLGLDYLIVAGACDAPSYLVVSDGGAGAGCASVAMHAAGELWGLDVPATLARLRELHPGAARPASSAPPASAASCSPPSSTTAAAPIGRGGLGAVMGAKRLKAVVVAGGGERSPPVADPERLAFVVYEAEKLLKANPITSQALPEFGTSVLVNVLNQAGALPTRNFREPRSSSTRRRSRARRCAATTCKRRAACRGCGIGCARRTSTGDASGEGPEYESIWALGAACGVGDLKAIVEASYACNRAGMDTITMGSTIACAMELTERRAPRRRPALRRRRGGARRSSRPRRRGGGPGRRARPRARRASPRATAGPSSR